MARIRVRYFGVLHEITGKRSENVEIEDTAMISDLIKKLAKLHGQRLNEYVFGSNNKLKDGFAYAINGDSVSESELSKLKCKDVSEFAILPPISGGS